MTTLGRYRLGRQLGAGALGTVYLADGPDGPVAVKVIHPQLADIPRFRTRLLREAELARRVAGPGVVRVVDVDAAGAQPYLVTEYLAAPTLHERIRTQGPLAGAALQRFADSLLGALAAVHRAGIVHRDLKPTNVLVADDGSAHVVDFGLAGLADLAPSATEGRGTPQWMAPEVERGEAATVAADVWGWGQLVAYAASGDRRDPQAVPEPLRHKVLAAIAPDLDARREAYVPAAFPASALGAVPATDLPAEQATAARKRKVGAVVAAIAVAAAGVTVWSIARHGGDLATPLVLYDDTFHNGVTLNAYNGTNDAASTTRVRRGATAIEAQTTPQGVLFLQLPDTMRLKDYSQLEAWVWAPEVTTVKVTMTSANDDAAGVNASVTLLDEAWTHVTVSLDDLVRERTAYDHATQRMLWFTLDTKAKGPISFDDLAFTAG